MGNLKRSVTLKVREKEGSTERNSREKLSKRRTGDSSLNLVISTYLPDNEEILSVIAMD